MEPNKDTVEIMGKKFLKCQQEDCEWNIGWLGGNSWSEESGKGIRICNLGVKAMIETEAVPPDECPRASAVLEGFTTEYLLIVSWALIIFVAALAKELLKVLSVKVIGSLTR